MAQYNFEEQLQRKLNARNIAPTANAWERIAYNRQSQQRRKKKAILYWIAAILIIAFGSITLLFQSKTETSDKVVIQQTPAVIQKETLPQINESPKPEKAVAAVTNRNHTSVETQHATVSGDISIDYEVPTSNPETETKKAAEVVATLEKMAQSGEKIDENDIDALLAKAQRDIAMERAGLKSQPLTDSNELLETAEKDVDKSFKDKVFDLFHHKFKTIKIALGDN